MPLACSDFKSYIQDKYCDVLTEAIQAFVNKHHDGIGFHGINVLSIAEQKVENVEVKSLVCHEDGIGDLLRMEVRTAADIVEISLGTKAIEASRRVCFAPGSYQRLEFFFRDTHFKSAH